MPNSSRYNLPKTGVPFESTGKTREGIENDYKVFSSNRYGQHFRRTLEEIEQFGNWVEDDGTLVGEYYGTEPDLQESYIEIDIGSEFEDYDGTTELYLPV